MAGLRYGGQIYDGNHKLGKNRFASGAILDIEELAMKQAGEFSPREKEVIEHLLQGKSNKQIALVLGISERTVEFHLQNIYERLHVKSAREAILQLGKSTVREVVREPVESTVEIHVESTENNDRSIFRRMPMKSLIIIIVVGSLFSFLFTQIYTHQSGPMGTVPQPTVRIDIIQGVNLPVPRSSHTATRLLNGKILLVGGYQGANQSLTETDIFDPVNGSIVQVTPLHTARHDHSAILLRDGRVLVVGGYSLPHQWLTDAEVYDPSNNTWTVVQPLYPHGVSHTATLLKDGRALVVGGCIGSGICTDKVETFDPRTNVWTELPSLPSERASHTANLLHDGRVLVAGGENAEGLTVGGDALIYDPKNNNWIPTGPMTKPRFLAGSVLLPGGDVLVAGGASGHPIPQTVTTVEIYNPTSNAWKPAGSLTTARYGFILTDFRGSQIIAIGGSRDWNSIWNDDSFVHEIEVYDPKEDRWATVGQLPQPAAFAAGISLKSDQRIWVTGGHQSGESILQTTWFLSPPHP